MYKSASKFGQRRRERLDSYRGINAKAFGRKFRRKKKRKVRKSANTNVRQHFPVSPRGNIQQDKAPRSSVSDRLDSLEEMVKLMLERHRIMFGVKL